MAKNDKYLFVYFCVAIIVIILVIVIFRFTKSHLEAFSSSGSDTIMREKHVVFSCTARNVEPYLSTLLGHIERCGKRFASWRLVVYENDSTDRTRQILQEYKANRNNIECIFEDGVAETSRKKRLANGRNSILDRIRSMPGPVDYVIVLDPDDVNMSGTFVDSIQHCFDPSLQPWDVMAGNQLNSYYYDIWALRYPPIIDYDIWASGKEFNIYSVHIPADKPPFQVDSAFGGIAVYRWNAIERCRYVGEYKADNPHGYPAGTDKCEHVELHECIRANGGSIWIHPAFATN
jgi:glycosyltransferase involved in cell wall biosynthesis